MAPKSRKNASKFALKFEAENHSKIEPTFGQNRAKMELKRHPKINLFLGRFLEASGNIGGIAAGLRRGCDGAAGVTLSPADPPGRRHIIKDYCTKTSKEDCLEDLARLEPLARRIFVNCPHDFSQTVLALWGSGGA